MKVNRQEFIKQELASKDTIDVKRVYVDMAGDLVTGVLLSQIIYWHLPDKHGDSKLKSFHDGEYWIANGREDWWDQCRITDRQFDRALTQLKARGLVIAGLYKFNGSPMIHIRLDWDNFLSMYDKALKGEFDFTLTVKSHKRRNQFDAERKKDITLKSNSLTETTAKTTPKNTKESSDAKTASPAVDSIRVVYPATSQSPTQEQGIATIYTNNASTYTVKDVPMTPTASEQFDAMPSASADSVKPSKRKHDSALYDIAAALAEVSGWDFEINKGRIFADAKRLSKAAIAPTAELIREKYSLRGWWYTSYWLGRDKCESPTPAAIVQTWGQWAKPNIIPFNKRQTISETLQQMKAEGKTFESQPECDELDQQWRRVLAQLKLSMPKEVFNTWYRNTRVMGWADFNKLAIDVKTIAAKEWIEKRGVDEINKAASDVFGETVTVYLESQSDGCAEAREAAR